MKACVSVHADVLSWKEENATLSWWRQPWKIVAGLERQGILSPMGKPNWNREAINKLLSNEKYTGQVLLQKTISTNTAQIENDGLMERYIYIGIHEAIISDEMFKAVQKDKQKRSNTPENKGSVQNKDLMV